jgi:hypothetical protein
MPELGPDVLSIGFKATYFLASEAFLPFSLFPPQVCQCTAWVDHEAIRSEYASGTIDK